MKVGLRLGLCIRDIITGQVDEDDVFVLVLTSKFNPNQPGIWEALWKVYGPVEWKTTHPESEYRQLVTSLYNKGKIHQPKTFGGAGHPHRQTWMNLVDEDEEMETSQFESKSMELPVKTTDIQQFPEILKFEIPKPVIPINEKINFSSLDGLEVSEIADFSAFGNIDIDLTKI